MSTTTQLWLGTELSFSKSLEANARAAEKPEFTASSDYMTALAEQFVTIQDGVALISLAGSLTSGSAGYGIYFGAMGYEDFRNILSQVVADQSVSSIVLNVDSGGGAVAGVQEAAQLLARVNAIKPVVTYTGSMMASAAIWIGANASHVMASETAIVGSIGIIRVHMDYSKAMELNGVTATIIRAGAEKALASPYEPLSDLAKTNMQEQANQMYGIFIRDMAKSRNIPTATADTQFGQGREFLGKAAVSVGLIDSVGTLEAAFTKAQKLAVAASGGTKKTVAPTKASNLASVQVNAGSASTVVADNQPTLEGNPMSKPLTDEQLAAMAAGVDLTVAQASADVTQAAANVADTAPITEPVTQATAEPTDALSILTSMLTKAQADVLAAKLENQTLQASIDTKGSEFDALQVQASATLEIARASVKTMGLHFGIKADAVASMAASEILAKHSELSEMFKAKFKVGGVAATTQESVASKVAVDPMLAARFKSSTAK